MLRTEYIRSLNCNYERILLDRKPEEKRYQYCILSRGGMKGLLPCSLRYINGLAYLYYDISSRQSMAKCYETKSIDRVWLKDFAWGMKRVRMELERFLLDYSNLVWNPEQVFQELEGNFFSFMYIPYYEGECSFGSFVEFLVEHIDYNDEQLVECVYHIYEQYEKGGEVYLQSQLFEDLGKLDEPASKSEQKTEADNVSGVETEEVPEEEQNDHTAEQRKGILGIFDSRRKKNREQRETYKQSQHQAMNGCAVAEETNYDGEEYGQTVYMEIEEGRERGLYYPDGRLLINLGRAVMTVGKKKEEADVVLEDSSISRIHARIIKEKELYYLEDLNSTNGTFKNGLRLQPYEKRCLEEGDDIRCGRIALVFR